VKAGKGRRTIVCSVVSEQNIFVEEANWLSDVKEDM
jgi:hypothetical protein